jgi:ssDNA-binding replication factor A large subunit
MEGSVIEIANANLRESEMHLGSFSELKLSKEILNDVKTERVLKEKNIIDFRNSDNINVRAFIVQASDLRFFNVCSECKRKVIIDGENFTCQSHGKVAPEKRALINVVLDDGTETIRAVLFHEKISDLGINQLDDFETVSKQKQEIIGKEMIFSGSVRLNNFSNSLEMVIDGFKEIVIDDLLVNLEKS